MLPGGRRHMDELAALEERMGAAMAVDLKVRTAQLPPHQGVDSTVAIIVMPGHGSCNCCTNRKRDGPGPGAGRG
jgi:hypothetical protein